MTAPTRDAPGHEPSWTSLQQRAASLLGEPEAALLCGSARAAASRAQLDLVEARVDARLRASLAEQRAALATIEYRYVRAVERLDRWVAALMAATWVAGAATVIVVASVS